MNPQHLTISHYLVTSVHTRATCNFTQYYVYTSVLHHDNTTHCLGLALAGVKLPATHIERSKSVPGYIISDLWRTQWQVFSLFRCQLSLHQYITLTYRLRLVQPATGGHYDFCFYIFHSTTDTITICHFEWHLSL